jgi:DNA polymerase-3 subunit delta
MPWKPEQLDRHLAGNALKPVYLLAGDEHLLLLEAADALRARARALGYAEREVLEAERGFDWNDLARAAASRSLFATQRLLDLRLPTGRPGIEGAAAITAFVRSPPPDTVLLITSMTWSRDHEGAWVRAVEEAGPVVVYWPIRAEELPGWIVRRAARAGLALAPDAVSALAERIEGNLLAAAQEIDKMALLLAAEPPGPGRAARSVDAATLEGLVADNARFDVFALADAALAGDCARALRITASLRAEGETVPALIGWLAMQFGALVRMAGAVERGASPDEALRKEYVRKDRVPAFRSALRRGNRAFWESRLAELGRVERTSKGRGDGDPWREFERLLASAADARLARAMVAP